MPDVPMPPSDPAAFVQFLIAEGLLSDQTLPSGRDPEAFLAEQVRAGRISATQLAAARERFAADPTLATRRTADGTLPSPTPPASAPATAAAAAPQDPLLGRVLGGCRLDKLLGEGGMGAVYLATQTSLDRRVAVKIQKEIAIPELVERFRTEARTLGKLRSPHIVDVYEVGSEQGLPWFVMEFMPGGSLASHVKKLPGARLPADDARRLLLESALGLAEAAEHGVLHRDIKPDNLLLDERGTLKIADFGIAKVLSDDPGLTQTGFSPGTPAFKSPEQVAGRDLDFRTDMYSLGVSFWALVTGERPRDVVTRQEAMEQTDRRSLPWSSPELPQANGDALLETICRMMALKREDRFASWQDLIAGLRTPAAAAAPKTAKGGTVVRAATVPTAAPATPARRGASTLGIGVGVVALAGLAFAFWPKGGDTPPASPPTNPSQTASPTGQAQPPTQPPTRNPEPRPADPRTDDPGTATAKPEPSGPTEKPVPERPPQDPGGDAAAAARAAREQLLAEFAQPLPATPRTADEIRTVAAGLRARATATGLLDDERWRDALQRLDAEQQAAEALGALRAVTALHAFGELETLRQRAAAIPLANYRTAATEHVDRLDRERPRALRLATGDREWLATWAAWDVTDDNTDERGGRLLPRRVRDQRRGDCALVLLWDRDGQPFYLDATEVTFGQWRLKFAVPTDLEGPTGDEFPVRGVDRATIASFLGAYGLRLPTVAEFGVALGARADDGYWWGNGEAPPAGYARINIADVARQKVDKLAPYLKGYDDGVADVAAANDPRFAQGQDGAFCHLLGNVAEWVQDGADQVVIGGSYLVNSWAAFARSYRQPVLGDRRPFVGFRAARSVPPPR